MILPQTDKFFLFNFITFINSFFNKFFAQIFPLGNIFIKKKNFENLFRIYSDFKSLSIFKN